MKRWTWIAAATAAFFFALALNGAVYDATSPSYLDWHIALRKTYSVIAFTIAGVTFGRAAREWRRPFSLAGLAFAVAAYSAAIEIGQRFTGSHESWQSNLLDVGCGAIGGALAWIADGRRIER
jgi:hypothetical protein